MIRQIREVKVIDLITYSLIPPLIIAALWIITPLYLVEFITQHISVKPYVIYTVAGIITYFPLKRWAIGVVLVYKAFAPMSVRARCLFTPTCSTYMIMAIGKYGLFIGAIKGFCRVLRCHPPNGGVDYP